MSKRWTLGFVTVFALFTAGCGSTALRAQDARVVASESHLVVEVEGGGAVDLGPSRDACDASAACEIDSERVADPVLVAEAKPGWRFDHWETPAPNGASPSFDDPRQPQVYRAVFRKTDGQIAKR